MSALSILANGRVAADALMVDTCTITNPGVGEGTFDEDTGITTSPVGELIYTGPCRVQASMAVQASNPIVGATEYTLVTFTISVPVAVTGVEVGAFITVTSSLKDPDLVGRQFTTTSLIHKTYLTARRLVCEEVA